MAFARPFVVAAALAAAAVPTTSAMEPDEATVLQLAVVDLRELPRELLRAAWDQTAAVLDRLGARLRIRWAAPGDVQDGSALTVVLLPGRPGPRLKATVLGVVQPAGAPRVLWLFPEVVAGALGLPDAARAAWTPQEQAVLATALGRVTAHELVHLVCPWRAHDREGLMAERMSQAILRGGRLEIDDALRRDFERGAVQAAARSRVADAGSSPSL
jgi:hypothetical protein